MPKIALRDVDGVVLLDKPAGITSNAALQQVRRLFQARKGGHAGTLDPFATGLMIICLGEATKFVQFLLASCKSYQAVVRLGIRTSTGDPEGEILEAVEVSSVERTKISSVLDSFVGDGEQVPPMFSALKVNGRPLYSYARAGIAIERSPRLVQIHDMALVDINGPFVSFSVTCSKGTYIRTLAEDIGKAMGCGGSLSALRRTKVGALDISEAVTIDMIEGADRDFCLRPIDFGIRDLPSLTLDRKEARDVAQGRRCPRPGASELPAARLIDGTGRFLGIGAIREESLIPTRMVAPGEQRDIG